MWDRGEGAGDAEALVSKETEVFGDLEPTFFCLVFVIQLWCTDYVLGSVFLLPPGKVCPSAHLKHTARWAWFGCWARYQKNAEI